MPSTAQQTELDPRRWVISVILTLLLHALALLVLELSRPFSPDPAQASPSAPIDLVFAAQVPEASVPQESPSDEPTFFSELPEDRADRPPEDPDFLSNVDSRARDRSTDETGSDLPRLEGESDAPHVGMEPQAGSETPPSDSPAPLADRSSTPAPESLPEIEGGESEGEFAELGERPRDGDAGARQPSPTTGRPPRDPREELFRSSPPPAPEPPRYRLGVGAQDLFQEEMNNRTGSVSLFGDVSLNTIAWAWAPWLQRFARDFHRNWFPPYAYLLGIIHGHDVIEVEVAQDGRLLRLDLLEAEGHESLAQASEAAFRAMAPFQPLPPDFPEETLILRVKLVYPKHR
jgi:outer membrane biosynthesis protein TonB